MTTIKTFLQSHTPYDLLPVSLKVIALDSTLTIRQCVSVLVKNGLVAVPIWNTKTQTFFGLFTVKDVMHLLVTLEKKSPLGIKEKKIEFYEQLKLLFDSSVEALRDIDANRIGLQPIHIHPLKSLEDATQLMIHGHLHHIALIDADSITHQETLVSVLTGFKILKFLACNCPAIFQVPGTLQELKIGKYHHLHSVNPSSTFMDAIRILQLEGYPFLPVVNEQHQLVNVITEMDILRALQDLSNPFSSMDRTIQSLLQSRRSTSTPWICHEQIYLCQPQDTFTQLMHQLKSMEFIPRFIMVNPLDQTLLGIISIGDLLRFIFEKRKMSTKN